MSNPWTDVVGADGEVVPGKVGQVATVPNEILAAPERLLVRDYLAPNGRILRVECRIPGNMPATPTGIAMVESYFAAERDAAFAKEQV